MTSEKSKYPLIQIPQEIQNHPAWVRLEDQINWYSSKSVRCQNYYKRLQFLQVLTAVLIPIFSMLEGDALKIVTALAGALIAVVEAIQHMNQYSTLWVTYRSTAERLKHEKFLFLSGAGPYKGTTDDDRSIILAERVEEHVSTEHANWFNETKSNAVLKKD